MRSYSSGLTLIELLMVTAISAILMGIAAPGLRDWISRRAAAAAAEALNADFRLARSEAVKRGDFVTICRSTDGSTCAGAGDWKTGWLVFVNRAAAANSTTNAIVLRVQEPLPSVTSMAPQQFGPVTFTSNGSAPGAAGSLVVASTAQGGAVALCLSMAGRLQARPGQASC